MKFICPDRETAKKRGWKYQVQWIEDGNLCHIRCISGAQADAWADKLRKQSLNPVVYDLAEELQLH